MYSHDFIAGKYSVKSLASLSASVQFPYIHIPALLGNHFFFYKTLVPLYSPTQLVGCECTVHCHKRGYCIRKLCSVRLKCIENWKLGLRLVFQCSDLIETG